MLAKTLASGAMGFVLATGIGSAFAAETSNPDQEAMKALMESVTREIVETDTGVQIIVHAEGDAIQAIQEHAQEREAKHAERENAPDDITHVMELTDDGFIVSISSDDPERVEDIQERAENGPAFGPGRGKGPHGDHEPHCEREDEPELES